jgi:putative NIF3 family GTP cyclohydrolase 1 type 2
MASAVKDRLPLRYALYPGSWAEPWDRVGLQVGEPDTKPFRERR